MSEAPPALSTPFGVTTAISAAVFYLMFYLVSGPLEGVFWGSAYRKFHRTVAQKRDWNSRIVAWIHSVYAAQGSLRAIWHIPLAEYADHVTVLQVDPFTQYYLEVTLGYFIYDLVFCCLPPLWEKQPHALEDVIHHCVAIFSYIAGIPVGVGAFSMICFQGNELSSPFLHLRWFYNAARKDDTLVYRATTAIFIVIFFFHRVLYNSFVIYVTFVQTFAEWDLLLGVVSATQIVFQLCCSLIFVGVQILWFGFILKKIYVAVSAGEGTNFGAQKGEYIR